MLRLGFVNQTRQQLQAGAKLRADDFSIVHASDDTKQVKIRIQCVFNPDYFFNARLSNGNYMFEMCPGKFLEKETETVEDKAAFLDNIAEWSIRIIEELEALPLQRELAVVESEINKIRVETSVLPDNYFLPEETAELKKRLDKLQSELGAHIHKQSSSKGEAEQQIDRLGSDFQVLNTTIVGLNRKQWTRLLFMRLGNWVVAPDGLSSLKSGADLTKFLLADGVQQ